MCGTRQICESTFFCYEAWNRTQSIGMEIDIEALIKQTAPAKNFKIYISVDYTMLDFFIYFQGKVLNRL